MTDSMYMRSVNDYSLSAHELFNKHTGLKLPAHTHVYNVKEVKADQLPEIVEEIDNGFIQQGYTLTDSYEVGYRDGILDPEDADDGYNSPDYKQYFSVWYKPTDPENPKLDRIVTEIYRRSDEVIIIILGSVKQDWVNGVYETLSSRYKRVIVKEKVFYTIGQNSHGFTLDEMELTTTYVPENIPLHYNDSFLEVNDLILGSIDNNKRGLVLLHGIPGSGKTSYINQIICRGGARKVVYIPPYLAASLSDPRFVSFVRDKLKNCVLVIEDAEGALMSRETHGDNPAVSNILNIADGIMGNALNILIIATFNTSLDNIDKALRRRGRMIAEYHFDELSVEKAINLTHHLYGEEQDLVLEQTEDGKLRTLANIFTMQVNQPRTAAPVSRSFGFKP